MRDKVQTQETSGWNEKGFPSHTRVVAVIYTNEFLGFANYDKGWTGLMKDINGRYDLEVSRWHDLSDPMPKKEGENEKNNNVER